MEIGDIFPLPPKWRKRLSGTWRPGGERYLRIIFFDLKSLQMILRNPTPPPSMELKGFWKYLWKNPTLLFQLWNWVGFLYGFLHPMGFTAFWFSKIEGPTPWNLVVHLRGWEVQKPLRQNWNRLKMIWASLQLNRSLFSLLAPVELFFFLILVGLRSLGGERGGDIDMI